MASDFQNIPYWGNVCQRNLTNSFPRLEVRSLNCAFMRIPNEDSSEMFLLVTAAAAVFRPDRHRLRCKKA